MQQSPVDAAYEIFQKDQNYDVILLDMSTPLSELTGWEGAKKMFQLAKENTPPIVIVTGGTEEANQQLVEEANADTTLKEFVKKITFLTKSISMNTTLIHRINRLTTPIRIKTARAVNPIAASKD